MAIQNVFDSDGDSCARGNGARLWKGEKVEPQNTMSAFFSLCYYYKVWPIVRGDVSNRERRRRRHFHRSVTPA